MATCWTYHRVGQRRVIAPVVAVVVLSGCAATTGNVGAAEAGAAPDTASTAVEPDDDAPRTYTVQMAASPPEGNAMLLGFFPAGLQVRAGDRIEFERPEDGEPHTVTLGSSTPIPNGPSQFYKGVFGGPPRVDRSMPCYLDEGLPDRAEGCTPEQRDQVPFDGTQSWFNSGGLLDDEGFTLEIAEGTAPGAYEYFCLVHPEEMQGLINVVGEDEEPDTPEEVAARGEDTIAERVPLAETLLTEPPGEEDVAAGRRTSDFRVWANAFVPEDVEVTVGESVLWEVQGHHTLSFGLPESARPYYVRAEDGSTIENPEGATQIGDPTGWDGAGQFNSGLRVGWPSTYLVTFTRPGTYAYRCLVHYGMDGTVTVVDG